MRVILILPGLLPPSHVEGRWKVNFLQRLLARSHREDSSEASGRILFLSAIMRTSEVKVESELAYWSDFIKPPARHCYYCEPVHLHADLSDAIVFDSSHFGLTVAEAESLVDGINQYLQNNPYRIEIANPYRWYLLSENRISMEIPTLRQMHGRPMGNVLTVFEHASEWRRLMNELQIVLHQQTINMEREQRGEPPINGVWIHPGVTIKVPEYSVDLIVTKSPWAQTMCKRLSMNYVAELDDSVLAGQQGDMLVFDETLVSGKNPENRRLQLESMEACWFEPMYGWLRRKKIDEIIIDSAGGSRFVIHRKSLRRFWKRLLPLQAYARQRP